MELFVQVDLSKHNPADSLITFNEYSTRQKSCRFWKVQSKQAEKHIHHFLILIYIIKY